MGGFALEFGHGSRQGVSRLSEGVQRRSRKSSGYDCVLLGMRGGSLGPGIGLNESVQRWDLLLGVEFGTGHGIGMRDSERFSDGVQRASD